MINRRTASDTGRTRNACPSSRCRQALERVVDPVLESLISAHFEANTGKIIGMTGKSWLPGH